MAENSNNPNTSNTSNNYKPCPACLARHDWREGGEEMAKYFGVVRVIICDRTPKDRAYFLNATDFVTNSEEIGEE